MKSMTYTASWRQWRHPLATVFSAAAGGQAQGDSAMRIIAACALAFFATSAMAQNLIQNDPFTYRNCAGYFWSEMQCVVPQFREAYGSAFLSMARRAATLEHKPIPLTQEEAIQSLSATLREWNPDLCQDARQTMTMFGDTCTGLLRGH
jgi:activator of 2-hydroxyglutaryl-CoA dehydratase